MKFCHIISAFHRYDTRIFLKQSRALANAGFEVYLLANDNLGYEERDRVKIVCTDFTSTSRLKRIVMAGNLLYSKALEINADIYQIHDPELIPLGLKLKRLGKRIIYDSHEDFPRQILEKDWIPKIFRQSISQLSAAYLKGTLKKFDLVITVTPHIADSLRHFVESVYVITNFPLIEKDFKPSSKSEYIARDNILCYAGTVYRSSLQENIIQAISNLPVKYVVIGDISSSYLESLERIISKSNVEFISFIPRSNLVEFYNKSYAGIAIFDYSPNLGYKEGSLGVNKIFEYMYYGLPVICTDFNLWIDFIDKYKCGIYVNPTNISQICNAVEYIITNREEAYRMGCNGRRAIEVEYNWGAQSKLYIDAIRTLV